jgi:REP element-mobilizing transposase RayT
MDFVEGNIYHIYNRGNNKKQIFYSTKNYEYFLRKVKLYIVPNCDILSYILMPNHFHFLIHANEITQQPLKKGMIITNPLSEGLRLMLSTYAQAINKQEGKTGNLFQQNTKFKCVSLKHTDYSYVCFNYIHQNPLRAGLVEKLENWPYSSFNEYLPAATLEYCNKELATELLDLRMEKFYFDSYEAIEEDVSKILF